MGPGCAAHAACCFPPQQNCRCASLVCVRRMLWGWQWERLRVRHSTVRLSLVSFLMCEFMLVCIRQRLCWGKWGVGGYLVCSSKRLWNNSPILWLSLAAAQAWPSACQNRQTDGRDRVPAGTWHHRVQECHCSSVTQQPTCFPGHAVSKRGWNWIISRMTHWITVRDFDVVRHHW